MDEITTTSQRPRPGRQGSLKHRILGKTSDEQSVSSHSTPVPSPSSSHSGSLTSPAKKRIRTEESDTSSRSSTNTTRSDLSLSGSASAVTTPSHSPNPAPTYQPNQFNRGSLIQLANGKLKAIETISSEDFVQSAAMSANLKVEFSVVTRVEHSIGLSTNSNAIVIFFTVGHRSPEVGVEASIEHPFFVLGKGWSSISPPATVTRFGLTVGQLSPGDTCVSLSYKHSLNGETMGDTTSNVSSGEKRRLTQDNERSWNQNGNISIPSVVVTNPNNGQDHLVSFRRWSAPEDDRFLDSLPR